MRRLAMCLLVLAAACRRQTPPPARSVPDGSGAGVTTPSADLVRELRMLDVSLADGGRASLDTQITRPIGGLGAPLVILNHGSPREPSERAQMTPTAFSAQAAAFARRGYAVAVVMRRGFGKTSKDFAEAPGPCEDRDYLRASRIAASDVLGAIDALKKESWVDPKRIVLVGHSAGGMTALAAAAAGTPGVVAVVSFAGGRGSDAPDHVCQPERLLDSLRVFSGPANPPALWIYATNDHFFAPPLVRDMFDAYRSKGAPGELVFVDPFRDDGHAFFMRAPERDWWSLVEPFLAKQHLPVEVVIPRAPVAITPPSSLTPAGKTAFAEYLASDSVEKAFAIGGTSWAWSVGQRTRADAVDKALLHCREHSNSTQPCKVVAIGDALSSEP